MSKKFSFIFIFLASFFCLVLVNPSFAVAASVSILVQTDKGKPMNGVPITCTANKPKVGTNMPSPPIFGNLTTSSNGTANWSPETGDGYSYLCYVAYATSPDSCYSFEQLSTGKFSLGSGDNKTFSFTAKSTPTTCGNKVPETEEDALKYRDNPQKVAPIWGDAKPTTKPTLTPTLAPTDIPSPTANLNPESTVTVTKSNKTVIQNIQHTLDSWGERIWNVIGKLFKK